MTASAEIIRTTHLPQFGDVYFDLKNQYEIVLNIVKKNFFIVANISCNTNKNIKNWYDCIIFCYKKKSWNKFPKRARTLDYIFNRRCYTDNLQYKLR